MSKQISAAEPQQIRRCLEIRRAAFMFHAPSAYTAEEVTALLERDEEPGLRQMIDLQQLFVAKHEDEVIGLCGWRGANVYNLYVDPAWCRKGIGSRLLRRVEESFREKSSASVLNVDAGTYTEAFYVANGYEVVNRAVSSDGLSYLEMEKRFS